MAVLRPAHPPSASRGCPYAVPLAMAASGTPAARPHTCAPVSRCTTVPSRSPPQRLQRCESFSAALIASSTALIAFDSAPRQQSPPRAAPAAQPEQSPPRAAPAAPAARHPTPARRASRRRPAACADCARLARLGEPPVAPAGVPGEKWLYISYTRRERRGVTVNDYLQSVSHPAVYAAGDAAASGPPLTPTAAHDGEVSGFIFPILLYSQSRHTTFSLDGSGLSIIGDPSSL